MTILIERVKRAVSVLFEAETRCKQCGHLLAKEGQIKCRCGSYYQLNPTVIIYEGDTDPHSELTT